MKILTLLTADENKTLTNGEIYGKTLYLSKNLKPSDFHEIPDEEYEKITAVENI